MFATCIYNAETRGRLSQRLHHLCMIHNANTLQCNQLHRARTSYRDGCLQCVCVSLEPTASTREDSLLSLQTRTLSALLRWGLVPRTVKLVCPGAYLATIEVLNHSNHSDIAVRHSFRQPSHVCAPLTLNILKRTGLFRTM